MAGKGAYLDHLSQVPLFNALSKRELQRIARASDELQVKKGTMLLEQGVDGHEAYIVVDGSATVRRNGKKVATLSSGAVVGELSLLDGGPRTATVTADTDMSLLVISQPQFSGVLEEVPALSRKMLTALAVRVRELDRAAYG
jgi:CRP/FNR family cyclic AMP-dependent transcriptional regulator